MASSTSAARSLWSATPPTSWSTRRRSRRTRSNRSCRGHFALDRTTGMGLAVMSFSFRRGLPREADLVFDARFLKNPHYVPELKPLTGRDRPGVDYIATDPDYEPFIDSLEGMIGTLAHR